MSNFLNLSISQIAQATNASILGDENLKIQRVSSIELADNKSLTFVDKDKYIPALKASDAAAVLLGKKIEDLPITQLIVEDVDAALITALELFAPKIEFEPDVHSSAVVSPSAKIGEGCFIGAFVFLDKDVEIGDNTYIDSGVVIKAGSKVGSGCRIDANVSIYSNCTIGNNCIIQSNTTIGSCGFGYRAVDNMPKLIPHNGGVVIEDFVEIGANCCVDRAKFGNTTIGMGTKIDNQVQIAHNCQIGKCCLFAGQSAVAGSSKVGDGVVMGGKAGVSDHTVVAEGVKIAGASVITGRTKPNSVMLGYPAREYRHAMLTQGYVERLPKTMEKFRKLEKRVANLEKTDDNSN